MNEANVLGTARQPCSRNNTTVTKRLSFTRLYFASDLCDWLLNVWHPVRHQTKKEDAEIRSVYAAAFGYSRLFEVSEVLVCIQKARYVKSVQRYPKFTVEQTQMEIGSIQDNLTPVWKPNLYVVATRVRTTFNPSVVLWSGSILHMLLRTTNAWPTSS